MKSHNRSILYHAGIMREIDFHFARFISGLCPHDDPDIFMGAALVSNAAGNGDIYLDLALSAGKPLGESLGAESRLRCPELNAWTEKLHASPVVGSPGELRPLILDKKNRLYLYRYWDYEKKLADRILKRAQEHIGVIDESLLRNSLQRLFPEVSDNGIDWQKVAALAAILKKFCLISGGPGTGKTFTVANILALLFEQAGDGRLEILLAAPTGKAAARLSESIRTAKKTLNCRKDIIDAIPSESYTIHRLLKTIPGSPYFIHNSENRLPAAMIDLALMSKLLEAIPATARLILIGDKDQLASVEAGSVLGDICDRNRVHGFSERFCKRLEKITGKEFNVGIEHDNLKNGLQDCIVVLKKSFRFTDSSTIGQLSRSVNRGDVEKVLDVLKTSPIPINWIETQGRKDLFQALAKKIIQGYAEYLKTTDPQTALERFNRFKILCAVNIGPFGVNAVNMLAEKALSREGLIQPEQDWYMGRPVLITRNDYNLGLFNGDMGLTLPAPDSDNKDLYVYFPGSSGQLRRFLPQRLPEHATVFAMTVHKSQGSEFDDVLLILPEKDYPVLTRELIYTAITRARQNISIWGIEEVVRAAVLRKIERTSGLRDALWAS